MPLMFEWVQTIIITIIKSQERKGEEKGEERKEREKTIQQRFGRDSKEKNRKVSIKLNDNNHRDQIAEAEQKIKKFIECKKILLSI